MPSTNGADEDYCPPPHVVKDPCKIMLDIMLRDLPEARYNSNTHEDGEVSAIFTFCSCAHMSGRFLQQFKMSGTQVTNSEMAEESDVRVLPLSRSAAARMCLTNFSNSSK